MRSPFKGDFRITQKFGENKGYYQQFGLEGHEGLDLIPQGDDWTVLCVEDGDVVRDVDNPIDGKEYGNYVVVLNRETRRAWWYCHLAENYVGRKRKLKVGNPVGKMGASGNTTGAHLHLGLRLADQNGNAINLDNGYQGFIDPLPVLENVLEGGDPDMSRRETIAAVYRGMYGREATKEELDRWDQSRKDPAETVAELFGSLDLVERADSLLKQVSKLAEIFSEYSNAHRALDGKITGIAGDVGSLRSELEVQRQLASEAISKSSHNQEVVVSISEDLKSLRTQLDAFETKLEGLSDSVAKLLGEGVRDVTSNYPEWKKVVWRFVRVGLTGGIASLGAVQFANIDSSKKLLVVLISAFVSGLVQATTKYLRENKDYDTLMHKLPL